MLHQLATAVSNLPWRRRRAQRWGRAAGGQVWVSDRPMRPFSMCSGGNTEAMRNHEQILQAAQGVTQATERCTAGTRWAPVCQGEYASL